MMSLSLFRNVAIASAASAASAILLLTACSSRAFQRGESTLPAAAVPPPLSERSQTGSIRPNAVSTKVLFVGSFLDRNLVEIFQNGTFRKVGQIKRGINGPDAVWVDSHGLYVVNVYAPSITQYSYLTSAPFTYKAGMKSPIAVATNRVGDIFEADATGYINEYYQQANFVVTKCSVDGAVTGVATSTTGGAVFVAYYGAGVDHIVEFTDFSSCRNKILGVRPGETGEMAVDKHDDIIVTESNNGAVDIIKPPYKLVSGHLGTHWYHPSDVKINAANTRAWVVDTGGIVEVDYPSGKRAGSIGGSLAAASAVDGSNYVP